MEETDSNNLVMKESDTYERDERSERSEKLKKNKKL